MGYLADNKNEVWRLYHSEELSTGEIAKRFSVNQTSVVTLLRRMGVVKFRGKREYSLNHSFFEKIDTQEKAYLLGLYYADGSNTYIGRTTLQMIDLDIIEKAKSLLQYTGPIRTVDKSHVGTKTQYCLSINSKQMSNDLITNGCVPCKSNVLEYPHTDIVSEQLTSHFVRGFFDGDGGVSTNCIYFTSTRGFLQGINYQIVKRLGYSHMRWYEDKGGVSVTLSSGVRSFCCDVLNWIYKDSSVHLQRKYEKYIQFTQRI